LFEKYVKWDNFSLPIILFLLTTITRIPFTSKYLYHMDSVQFALALDRYDVTIHQPHPPGYFLYVMLGRLLNIFFHDANTVFVTISILFSGLAVLAIYLAGKELFGNRTGLFASLLAITSPAIWFHGEIALTYIVEGFLSAMTALLCWKVYKGKHNYIWFSAIVLGISGGIRQNTLIFLLPLWLYCIKEVRFHKIIASLGIICFTTLLWFIPMILMTGGLDVYMGAFRELWLFNTGNNSVFEEGWPVFKYYSSTLFDFTFYGLGAGLFFMVLALYSMVRNRKLNSPDMSRVLFFAFWILPSVLFYLLIFVHPANPGYALIYLPALVILAAASVSCMAEELRTLTGADLSIAIMVALLVVNIYIYFFSGYPISRGKIKENGRDLRVVLASLQPFDPSDTVIFTGPYIYWGYRQIMYYLPEYRVYQMDFKRAPSGEMRKIFWGQHRSTFLTDKIVLPNKIRNFAVLLSSEDKKRILGIKGVHIINILPNMCIITGPITMIRQIYPEMNFFPCP